MNGSLGHAFAHLLFFVCLGAGASALAQDHLVDAIGNVIPGRVIQPLMRRHNASVPVDRIDFRRDGERGAQSYAAAHVKGYYVQASGIFYATKFHLQREAYTFFPEHTPGEDQALFESVTGLEVKASGRIKLYKALQTVNEGAGAYTTVSYYVEKEGKLLVILPGSWNGQGEKQQLAPFIQTDAALLEWWMYRENKLTGELLEECIHRYNGTYTAGPLAGKTASADQLNGF
jgi:hypothetical protein